MAFLLTSCTSVPSLPGAEGWTGTPSALEPRGAGAEQIAALWWALFWIATAVYVVVLGVLLLGLLRPRQPPEQDAAQFSGERFVVAGGVVIPVIVLLGVYGLSLGTMRSLAHLERPPALTVAVTGHQWWWEIRYPEQGFSTANELHLPVGQPVRVEVTSLDVIHSFWIPQLDRKIDVIPGQTNTIWLEADRPGIYRGQCAEFCGLQHAKMALLAVADPPEAFAEWLRQQQQPALPPEEPLAQLGEQAFVREGCIACHTIRTAEGEAIGGSIGPDLTHVGSRRIIAAWFENSRGNLAGWIADAQALKPGNRMPNFTLDAESLRGLVAYLAGLE